MSNKKNILFLTVAIFGMVVLLQSCKDELSPGYEYMPDMYRSPSLETYSETNLTGDGKSALTPPENTIPRGYLPYAYPNSNEGYEAAGQYLKNPLAFSEERLEEGKAIYGKFCVHCHGKKGEGNGTVPENSDYPNPPSYSGPLKDLPEGKIFHTLTYGKNLMGSHASQINQEDRWKLVYYVQSLQDANRFDQMYRNGGMEEVAPETEETSDGEEMAMNQ